MTSRRELFSHAMKLLDQGAAGQAFAIGEQLISSGDSAAIVSGFMCCGFALEQGGDSLPQDLDRALSYFMRAAVAVPHIEADLNIARVLIKRGNDADVQRARKYLDDASRDGKSARINLGYAELYRTHKLRNVELELAHLSKAALRGRFAGFFGLARSLRREDRPVLALIVDTARVIVGPAIGLLLRAKAHERF
jgi:TPR repeat protein